MWFVMCSLRLSIGGVHATYVLIGLRSIEGKS